MRERSSLIVFAAQIGLRRVRLCNDSSKFADASTPGPPGWLSARSAQRCADQSSRRHTDHLTHASTRHRPSRQQTMVTWSCVSSLPSHFGKSPLFFSNIIKMSSRNRVSCRVLKLVQRAFSASTRPSQWRTVKEAAQHDRPAGLSCLSNA